jgi:hypothetical protein
MKTLETLILSLGSAAAVMALCYLAAAVACMLLDALVDGLVWVWRRVR